MIPNIGTKKVIIPIFFVPVFKCKWVDNKSGVEIDELGFTQIGANIEW